MTLRPVQAFAALLACLFAALAFEAWTVGPTVDEPSHILSSYLWWHGRDRLYPRDLPPLIKIVGGWPAALRGLPVPPDLGKPGDTRSEWVEAAIMFGRIPASRLQLDLFLIRLPLLIFPLLVALLLWTWARELFGDWPALGVAALWCLGPTPLGHGALFKNDVAATFTYLLFWYTVWRFWKAPTWRMLALLSLATALALLSKFSLLWVLGVAPLILILRAALDRAPLRAVLHLAALAGIVWTVTASAWQFELFRASPADLASLAADAAIPRWFSAAASLVHWVPVPAAAWTGVLSLLKSNATTVPVYLFGQVYPDGHRGYFAIATLLKMAFPALLLVLGGIVILIRNPGRTTRKFADLFWILPGFLYFFLASLSSLHLGVRLVMPAWAFFFLIAGAAIQWLLQRTSGRPLLASAFAGLFLLSATCFPWGLTFFNPFVGGTPQALRYLADSNVDWGQSLGPAIRYAGTHGIPQIRVAYYGFDKLDRYCKPGQCVNVPIPWAQDAPVERYTPEPGWYAVSANLLPGHYFLPKYRDYFIEFHRRRPVAVAGGSMFIYRID